MSGVRKNNRAWLSHNRARIFNRGRQYGVNLEARDWGDEVPANTKERGMTLVVVSVPAEVYENCGEAMWSEAMVSELLRRSEEAAWAGVMLDIHEYAGATAQE